MRGKLSAVFIAVVAMVAFARAAGAVDGTIEINQAKVNLNFGFPFIISASGSYRLTGNLTVSSTTANAINVTAPDVTIDLNGFSISGPGSSSTSMGINAGAEADITVENGAVNGFQAGISVGNFSIVSRVHADLNGASGGIIAGFDSVIEGCSANNGSGTGITCAGNCRISGNAASGSTGANGIQIGSAGATVISGNTTVSNHNDGIHCGGGTCLITGNTIVSNGRDGIFANDKSTGFGGNIISNNFSDIGSAGTSLGAGNTNLCSGPIAC